MKSGKATSKLSFWRISDVIKVSKTSLTFDICDQSSSHLQKWFIWTCQFVGSDLKCQMSIVMTFWEFKLHQTLSFRQTDDNAAAGK